MKKSTKNAIGITVGTLAVVLTFGVVSFSCKANNGSANVAFAETKPVVTIPKESLAVAEALQSTFRSIASGVLPAVVEVDVTEKTKVKTYNPFKDLPFFFGFPDQDDQKEDNYREYEQTGLGSGVIVRRNGKTNYVLTNNHVAGKATTIKIKLNDGREFDGKLVGADERIDIALVSFESDDQSIAIAALGDSDEVHTGDICIALGSPLGYFGSVTQGIVSATGRSGKGIGSISDFIQTDAAINQGNSGGPLVNIYGEVIGINTWIASSSGGSVGLGFSIPINNVKKAIDQFITKGKIVYGWLGVSLSDITKIYKDSLGINDEEGAFISEIFIGSPAEKGGIRAGDYVVELNGKKITSTEQLSREVGSIPSGEKANFVVLRGKNKVNLTITIDEREDNIVNDNSKLWPGFIATPLTEEFKTKNKITDKKVKGIVVANIIEKTPAAALRLQNGDIITAVTDFPVTSIEDFYEALDLNGKKEIWFDVWEEGHTISTGHYKFSK